MTRAGLFIVLALATVVGAVFAAFPGLDLAVSALFYDAGRGQWRSIEWPTFSLRDLASYLIALVVAPAVIALALKLLMPRRPMIVPARAALLMIATLIVGPGIVANLVLKDYWGRPRPWMVSEFGGSERFLPWWDPRGPCSNNCSFVAGEPSGAFWTLAPAAVTPPTVRVAAYAGAVVFGAAVGLLRISAGGHFLSDVIFAGVVMFLVVWLAHGFLYRWRRTRLTDAGLEHALERLATPGYDALMRLVARVRGTPPPT